jgi:hypothetical protein
VPSTCNRRRHVDEIDTKTDLKSTHAQQIEEHIQTRNDERQQTSLHYDLKIFKVRQS